MNKLIDRFFLRAKIYTKLEIVDRKQEAITKTAREQFLKLKEKGLSIPIFTL